MSIKPIASILKRLPRPNHRMGPASCKISHFCSQKQRPTTGENPKMKAYKMFSNKTHAHHHGVLNENQANCLSICSFQGVALTQGKFSIFALPRLLFHHLFLHLPVSSATFLPSLHLPPLSFKSHTRNNLKILLLIVFSQCLASQGHHALVKFDISHSAPLLCLSPSLFFFFSRDHFTQLVKN